jgi:O-antigen ligase
MRISAALTPFNAVRFRTSLSTKTTFEAKPRQQMDRLESVVLFALAALATLLVWSGDPLWNWACEGAMLLLAAVVSVRVCGQESGTKPDYKVFIPFAMIGVWGFAQLALSATAVRYATLTAALQYAAYASVAFSAAVILSSRQRREIWLQWFCWFAVGIGLVSVLAYHTSPGKILWLFPSAYPDNWGPFPSRNNFAQFLELSFPVAVYQFERLQAADNNKEARWLGGLAPAVLFACGIASASRAGSILLLLEALLMAILSRRSKGFAWAGMALATGALILVMGAGTLLGRFRDPDPMSGRREIFQAAWKMSLSRPWTGYGLGTFPYVYPEFAVFDPGSRVEHAHNDWLQWVSEGGIPFAAVWIFLTIFITRAALRSIWGVGILAVFVHALVDYPFAKLGVAAWLFALLGGLLAAERGFLSGGGVASERHGVAGKRRNSVKLKTVQSVVAALVSLNLSIAMAAPPPSGGAIGVAVTRGSLRVDDSTVSGNATLVEGTTVETQQDASSLQLTSGPHIALQAQSKGRVFGDHLQLERGVGELDRLIGYRVEARGLTIQPQTGSARARVALAGAHLVQVAALSGSFRVTNAKGLVIANLTPGAALEFDPQTSGQSEPWKLSGCLVSTAHHFTLTDDTTNVTVEVVGTGLDKEVGNKVDIRGALDSTGTPVSSATQVIRVSMVKRLGKNCTASSGKGTAAAAAGGAATGGAAAGGAAAGGASTVAGISTTAILIVGGVAAGAVVGGLAAADKLPGQGSAAVGSSR